MREAVADIDEEVERLNRIVNEVLDFARPIRFELAPADLNALCRESAAASVASGPGAAVHLDLDPGAAARHDRRRAAAHRAREHAGERAARRQRRSAGHVSRQSAAASTVDAARVRPGSSRLQRRERGQDGRVTIVIADRGAGIEPAHLPHVFDPYFTTKRGGTGLGLAIAKNIVEGLGGTIERRQRARRAAPRSASSLP